VNRLLRVPHLRLALAGALLLGFHSLPWWRWDGRQALLLDLAARRFDVFGLTLWPQDFGLLLSLCALLICVLALVTHLWGRLWCGQACPQTLWSTLFGHIERATRRACGDSMLEPVVRHAVWLGIALWTGVTFVGLFTPMDDLVERGLQGRWSPWEVLWVSFYAVATWGNAGFLRGHVCRVLCPFARVQAVLTDGHTPRFLYQASRGEPRGPRPAGLGSVAQRGRGLLDPTTAQDYVFRAAHPALAGGTARFSADRLGDCTDCGACTRACPVGLDVRAGPQADCLACGDCLLACNKAQHRAGLGSGLIHYDAPEHAAGAQRCYFRSKTLLLSLLFMLLLGITAWQGVFSLAST